MQTITVVTADGVSNEVLDLLKEDMEKTFTDPDHSIVTNFGMEIHQFEVESNDADVIVVKNK